MWESEAADAVAPSCEAKGLALSCELDPGLRERLRFEWMHPAVARYCLENGIEYPALDAEGEVVGPFPRGGSSLA